MRTEVAHFEVVVTVTLEGHERFTYEVASPAGRRRTVLVESVNVALPRMHVTGRGRTVRPDSLAAQTSRVHQMALADLPTVVLEAVNATYAEVVAIAGYVDPRPSPRVAIVSSTQVWECPYHIVSLEHYEDDGSCKCSSPRRKGLGTRHVQPRPTSGIPSLHWRWRGTDGTVPDAAWPGPVTLESPYPRKDKHSDTVLVTPVGKDATFLSFKEELEVRPS